MGGDMRKQLLRNCAGTIAAGAALALLTALAPSVARCEGNAFVPPARANHGLAVPARMRALSTQLARAHGDDAGEPYGDGKHEKAKHRHGGYREYAGGPYAGPFFRPGDAGYFNKCYGGSDISSLPPGLQKHVERTGHLPPGLEKQLARNGHLPPGLEKRMSPVSPCVLQRIGPLPPDSRLYMLGRDAYLINYHTRAIIDILRGAY
jgi:hypothetical protein